MQSSIDDVREGDPNSILSVNGLELSLSWLFVPRFILFSFSYIAANQNNGHLKLGCKLGATFLLNEKVDAFISHVQLTALLLVDHEKTLCCKVTA